MAMLVYRRVFLMVNWTFQGFWEKDTFLYPVFRGVTAMGVLAEPKKKIVGGGGGFVPQDLDTWLGGSPPIKSMGP